MVREGETSERKNPLERGLYMSVDASSNKGSTLKPSMFSGSKFGKQKRGNLKPILKSSKKSKPLITWQNNQNETCRLGR